MDQIQAAEGAFGKGREMSEVCPTCGRRLRPGRPKGGHNKPGSKKTGPKLRAQKPERVPKRGPMPWIDHQQRDAEMIAMYKAGDVLETIGARYGITRERVRQRLKMNGITKKDGGAHAQQRVLAPMRAEARRLKDEERAALCLKKHGMTLDQYRAHIAKYGNERTKGTPRYVYKNLRNTMRFMGVPWALSFGDWWQVWLDSGKWRWHGRGHGYGLSRINCDLGFTKDNVHIIRGDQRARDSYIRTPAAVRTEKRRVTIAAKAAS